MLYTAADDILILNISWLSSAVAAALINIAKAFCIIK